MGLGRGAVKPWLQARVEVLLSSADTEFRGMTRKW